MLTVLTLSPSSVPISDTVRPAPIIRSTWYSRSDSAPCGGGSPSRPRRLLQLRGHVPPAGERRAHRSHQLLRITVLGDVADRAGLQRPLRELIRGVHADNQNRDGGEVAAQPA